MNRKNFLISLVSLSFLFSFINLSIVNSNPLDNSFNSVPKTAGYWVLAGIDIDDSIPAKSWSWHSTNTAWVSGSGTIGDPYLIENVYIDASGGVSGISIANSNKYFIIRNCTSFNSGGAFGEAGLALISINNGRIIDCNFTYNPISVSVYMYSVNHTIIDNCLCNLNGFYGIYIDDDCNWNSISNCEINNNSVFMGLFSTSNNNYNIFFNNEIIGNALTGIYMSYGDFNKILDNTISYNVQEGILLENCDNTEIIGNTIFQNGNGIFSGGIVLDECVGNEISENIILDNADWGIYAHSDSDNLLISNNQVENNDELGIYTTYCDFVKIHQNIVKNNYKWGIYLDHSHYSNMSENYITKHLWMSLTIDDSDSCFAQNNTIDNIGMTNVYPMVRIQSSTNSIVSGNTIQNSALEGLSLVNGDGTLITQNIIRNNWKSIVLESGSSSNLIYLNYFYNNQYNAQDDSCGNFWNNSVIGNYWDNYSGIDANRDGIGDTPYDISGVATKQDHLPIYDLTQDFPQAFVLNTSAEDPDLDGNFFLNWTSSQNAICYYVYMFNSTITEINDSLILVAGNITTLNLTLSLHSSGVFYYIVVASNQYANITSNCIMVNVTLVRVPQLSWSDVIFMFSIIGGFALITIYYLNNYRKKRK